MNWIEQIFGWDPDQGSGALELSLALLVVAVIVAAGLYAWSRRQEISGLVAGVRR
jgi:uncharacterized protein HemX